MLDSKQGYITDTPYLSQFYSLQSPVQLHYVARLRGATSRPPSEPFTYCELGCGNGVTSNVLAAALPHGEFYAADLNPDHIENCRRTARRAGVTNVTFFEKSFEELLHEDLPAFDYIALHGVYSWVGPEVRRDILRVVDRFLKPDGLLYISYNTMPGWAPLLPIRQIMLSHIDGITGSSRDKALHGVAYLKHLRDNQAAYFQKNPIADSLLDRLLEMDPAYVAHEYLNKSWEPLYFSQVAADLAPIGVSYCGAAKIQQNYVDATVPEQLRSTLDAASDKLAYETFKSLILDEQFRCDLFCRTENYRSQADRIATFADEIFGAERPPEAFRREVKIGQRTVSYHGPLYDTLIPLVAGGTRSIAELCRLPDLAGHSQRAVTVAIQNLVAGGQLRPLVRPAPMAETGRANHPRLTSEINRVLLEDRLLEGPGCPLASSVLGNGIRLEPIPGLLLFAVDAVGYETAVEHALGLVRASGRTWHDRDREISDPAQAREALEDALTSFRETTVPALHRCGLIETAD